jgi:hypothetical protein
MDDPQVVSALRGAKYGAAAGLGAALIVTNENLPFSFFSVPLGYVFGYWIGFGIAIGAGIGWWHAGRT